MKTANLVRTLPNMGSERALYKLDPPMEGHEYVVVSAADLRRVRGGHHR